MENIELNAKARMERKKKKKMQQGSASAATSQATCVRQKERLVCYCRLGLHYLQRVTCDRLPADYVNERLTQLSTQPRLNVGQNAKLEERERDRANRTVGGKKRRPQTQHGHVPSLIRVDPSY